jgi:hypothetical protein
MKIAMAVLLCSSLAQFFIGVPSAGGQTPSEIVIAGGTHLVLELNEHLSTRLNSEGDRFTATVAAPLFISDRLAIPKGSLVSGTVGRIQRPGRFRGKAVMNLVFQSIRVPGCGELPLVATLVRINSDGKAEVKSEGTVQGAGSTGRDVGRVATPTASGAGIGGLAGGGTGAAVGAGVGAAVGLVTIFATRGQDLEVRRGASLDIALERPLVLPAEAAEGGVPSRIR